MDAHVVYIGEATGKMKNRWDAFHKATFFRTPRTRRLTPDIADDNVLFVAYMPIRGSDARYLETLDADRQSLLSRSNAPEARVDKYIKSLKRRSPAKEKDPASSAWIKLVERILIFKFCQEWGRLPECNKE